MTSPLYLTEATTKDELLAFWIANTNELIDAFIAANVDPDLPETTADEIRAVLIQWCVDGDECATA
jgi:hypothetical protein